MVRILFLAVLATSIFITGCTTLPDLKAKLDAAPACCTDAAQMQFQPLTTAEDVPFVLGSNSPAFIFETGKSYFAAFALPSVAPGRQLEIQAYATGSTAFESRTLAQIFCPRVLFLDAKKQPLGTMEVAGQYDRFKGFGGFRRGAGSGFLIPSDAAFAVVHANPGVFGNFRAMSTSGGAYMVGNALVIDRGGEYFYFPCAPIADARIRIR